jgi:hypothetical protein
MIAPRITKEQARESLRARALLFSALAEDEAMRTEGPTPIHTLRRFHDLCPQDEIPGFEHSSQLRNPDDQ